MANQTAQPSGTGLTGSLYTKLSDGTYTPVVDENGNLVSGVALDAVPLTASGAIPETASFVTLNSTTPAIAATIAAPTAGRFLVITQIDSGTAGHTVTLTAGTYDGTNEIATFNAQNETLVLFGISATRFVIVQNIGSVGLST